MLMTLEQKERYIESFDENYMRDYLVQMKDVDWDLVYKPDPKEVSFDYQLIIAEEEFDRLTKEFVEEITRR